MTTTQIATMRKRTRVQPKDEDALHCQCVDFLRFCAPDLEAIGLYWTAVNPSPSKSRAVAGRSKAMGMRAGAGDFVFLFRGLWLNIELKNGSKSPQNKAQKQTEREVVAAGGEYWIARNLDEFVDILRWQGVPLRDLVYY